MDKALLAKVELATARAFGVGDRESGRLLALSQLLQRTIIEWLRQRGRPFLFSSAMTVQTMKGTVHGREDLARVKVGVVHGSPGEEYMRDRRMNSIRYETLEEALRAVVDERVDAVVAEKPVLAHMIDMIHPEHLIMLPHTFGMDNHAFILPSESPLREPVNRLLLQFVETDAWSRILHRYLGAY